MIAYVAIIQKKNEIPETIVFKDKEKAFTYLYKNTVPQCSFECFCGSLVRELFYKDANGTLAALQLKSIHMEMG